jgi:hypothetical protein
MADIGALYVRVLADVKTLATDLKAKMTSTATEAETSGKKVGGSFGKGIAAAATAFAGLAVLRYSEQAGKAASELQFDMEKTKAVFGSAGESVVGWSKNSASALGLSQDQALTLANNLGNLYKSYGLTGKGASQLAEKSISLGNDLATFYKKDPAAGINAIRLATAGAFRGLRQFGIVITKADVTAQALSMGLGHTTVNMNQLHSAQNAVTTAEINYDAAVKKHGKSSTEAQKAALALANAHYKVNQVLNSGKTTLTAAERAQATYALVEKRAGAATGAFRKEGSSLEVQNRRSAAQFANMKAQLGTALLPVMTTVGKIISTQVAPALVKMSTFVAKNRAVLIPLIAALTAFVIAVKATKAVSGFAEDVGKAAKAVKDLNIGEKLAAVYQKAMAAAQWLLNAAMDANPVVLIVLAIVALIAILVIAYMKVGWFRNAVQLAFGAIAAAAKVVWNAVVAAFHWIVNAIAGVIDWLKVNWPLIVGILLGPIGLVVGIFIRWRTQIVGLVTSAFRAVLSVIVAVFGTIVGFVAGAVGRVVAWFATLPGQLLALGAGAINAFLAGVVAAWGAVSGWLSGVGWRAVAAVGNLAGMLVGSGSSLVGSLVSGFVAAWGGVTGWLSTVGSRAKNAVGDLSRILYDAGRAIIQGLIDGIGSMVSGVTGALGKITSLIPIHKGPRERDAKLLQPAGVAIMQGLMGGIDSQMTNLKRTLGGVTAAVAIHAPAGVGAAAGRRGPTVGTMYVQSLDARHVANAVADKLAYAELRGQTL